MDDRLKAFLILVPTANWSKSPPRVWSEQTRQALSEGYIRMGWGSRIQLTDAGKNALALSRPNSRSDG